MKRLLIIAVILCGFSLNAKATGHFQVSVGFGYFYNSLSPYGEWIESDFGYAWRPLHISHGWRPYLHGRWVWTHYGWYWVSREPFGWATFHYGRWYYDDYYGWIWIPDYEWGPGWVEWCYNDDYIGWAPLSPYAHFSINIGITFVNNWITPVHYWNFIPYRHFTSTKIVNYVQPIERNRHIIGNTRSGGTIRSRDNMIINNGIEVDRIERATRTRIQRVEVVERDRGHEERFVREGGRERIEVYKPRIERDARDAQLTPQVKRSKPERSPAIIQRDRNKERMPAGELPDKRPNRSIERVVPEKKENRATQNRIDIRERKEIQRQESQQRQEKQRETLERRNTEQRNRSEIQSRQIPKYERVVPRSNERRNTEQARPQKPSRPPEQRSGKRPGR